MNNQKLQNFIDLVAFDQNLIALESMIVLSEKKLQKLQVESQKNQKKIEEKAVEKKELKKIFDLQELHIKDLQDKESHQAIVIERAKNSKECDAASKELDHIRAERIRQEKKLMQSWNSYLAVDKEVELLHAEHAQKAIQVEEEIAQENKVLNELQKELQAQRGQRDPKVASLPEEWIVFYENLRGKVANPVVPVSQDSCSVCFYLISSRDLQTLRNNELVSCKDCYRFLYFNLNANMQDAK